MRPLRHAVLLLALLGSVGLVHAATRPAPARPAPTPGVVVKNAESDPVPVTVTNPATGTTVTNTGSNPVPVQVLRLPKLRDGHAFIELSADAEKRYLKVPVGVVLTDYVVRRMAGPDEACWVSLFATSPTASGAMYDIFLSPAQPVAESHFRSGVASSAERVVGFFMNANCRAKVFWSGYEQ